VCFLYNGIEKTTSKLIVKEKLNEEP